MKIAIPVAGTDLAPDFSDAPEFALYDVDNDTNAVAYHGRHAVPTPGCFNSSQALQSQQVEFVIAAGISQNAINHLLAVGIVTAASMWAYDAFVRPPAPNVPLGAEKGPSAQRLPAAL